MQENHHLGDYFGTSKQLRETITHTRRVKLSRFPPFDINDKFFKVDKRLLEDQVKPLEMILIDWQDTVSKQRILLIGSVETLKHLCKSTMWQADGTFRSCSKPFSQLVTIFGNNVSNDEYTCYGMLYAFMTGKSIQMYQQLFKMISDLAQRHGFEVHIKYFLTDFESAISTAAQSQFPHILLYYCFFHFDNTLLKQIRTLGLWDEYCKPENKRLIRLLFALPMLPPGLITIAFGAIHEQGIPPEIEPMFEYFFINFISGPFKPANWSLYLLMLKGLPKSQSFIESSHKILNLILSVKQPQFYKVTGQLGKQLNETDKQIKHHELYGESVKKRNVNYAASEKRIVELVKSCTEQNVLEKLQLISDILRMGKSFRAGSTRAMPPQGLPQVAEPTLPPLPVAQARPNVVHPIVDRSLPPARAHRSAELMQAQEAIANEAFEMSRNAADEEEEYLLDEAYDEYEVIDQQPDDLVVDNEFEAYEAVEYDIVEQLHELEQHNDIDDDPGYASGNDLADEGPGRSAGYRCNVCPKVCNTSRGLAIHKAVHKRKPKSCNKK